jgi:hypothetical protein
VGPLSSINPQAGSGAAIGKTPVFVHMDGYKGRKTGRGSFVEIRTKRGQAYFVKLFIVISRPIDGVFRQTVTALDAGDTAGFGPDGWDQKPRLSQLRPEEVRHMNPDWFPLMPGGVWFSGPGCYRLVNEGPGFRHAIDFPVDLVK